VRCLIIAAALATLTCGAFVLHTNLLTIGLLYLIVVMTVASLFGFWHASLTSILAVLLLDYYFEPPIFSFAVESPAMFVALVTFEGTALAISRLHGRELRIAREAAAYRAGMEKLYELSRSSLLLDLRRPVGPQLVVLIRRIFDAPAIALFDANLGRQDRVGDWQPGEEDLAKECYLRDAAKDDRQTQTFERLLRGGSKRAGALVVRGKLSPIVVDALAALAAIAIDRHQSFESEDRAEATKKSEQLRAAVMDALAHELKTPLTAVQTASSGLLELGGLSDSQAELVTLIDDQAVRLNELCTRLLQTAKLGPTPVDLNADEVNLKELISEVLAGGSSENGRNRIRVTVDDPALTMRVDRKLLGMILTQYVDNAEKYSNPGTPIEIDARKSHGEVLVSVHNFGAPIRIEERERIFDRFYRSPDRKDAVQGTGIGLSVVKKAAEAHHGHVWVISDQKEGTTFFLSLPDGVRRT
jgi:two-component system sensor histidine kinase KdpD